MRLLRLLLRLLLLLAPLVRVARADQELLEAIQAGDIRHVRRHLDELGKDPNHHDPWRKSALMHCAYACHVHGGEEPCKGHTDICALLIERGAEVNHVSDHGRTPLMAAAYVGNVGVVKMLIEKGADLNVQDKRHKYTALHHAINEIRHDHDAQHEEVIRELIDAGADMHLVASNGWTVEHMADRKKLYHFHLHRHVQHHVDKTRPPKSEL